MEKIQFADIADHTGSMPHGMSGLPIEAQRIINNKYGAREALHFDFRAENPLLLVGYNPTNPRHQGMREILSWYQRNLGCQPILVEIGIGDKIKKGFQRHELSLPVTNNIQIRGHGYFTPGYENGAIDYIGTDAEHAKNAKDKAKFSELSFKLGNEGTSEIDLHSAIPAEIFHLEDENTSDISDLIKNRLIQIRNMYDEIFLTTETKNEAKNFREGVVLRPTKMDGGFGNIFLSSEIDEFTKEEKWVISYEGTNHDFTSMNEAIESLLHGSKEFSGLVKSWEYIMTRKVKVDYTPSIGVHFDEKGFHLMPITSQIMDDSMTCIGGGSYHIANSNFLSKVSKYIPFISETTESILHHLFNQEDQRYFGHIGFDWIVCDQDEQSLIDTIIANPKLNEKYSSEFARVFMTECNPRHTLISAVTPALARATRASREENSLAVEQEDIDSLYGRDSKLGEAAFIVHDFVEIPEPWIKSICTEDSDEDNTGILLTGKLIAHIEDFNKKFKGQLVMIPRIDVYKKNMQGKSKFVCSVAIASVPQYNFAQSHSNINLLHNVWDMMNQENGVKLID